MERPIILNTEMVKAVLEGRKTQTRDVIKPQPRKGLEFIKMVHDWQGKAQAELETPSGYSDPLMYHPLCPHGKVGDRLWVREMFEIWTDGTGWECITYKADNYSCFLSNLSIKHDAHFDKKKWKSPVTMSRRASRITLEIVDIRVERLQDIDCEDAVTEGIECELCHNSGYITLNEHKQEECHCDTADLFAILWNSIHKKEHRWEDNKRVWVREFKRIKDKK